MDKNSGESGYRPKIILLEDEGYTVPEIRRAINHYDINLRKWIHRFNEKGIEGVISKISYTNGSITMILRKRLSEIATKNPRKEYDLPFSTWSLRYWQDMYQRNNLVDSISHNEIINIFLKYGIRQDNQK